MSNYRINNIYSTVPYDWQEKVNELIKENDNTCIAIQVPEKEGKTFYCRERLIDFLNHAGKGETALYYTPLKDTAIRVANTLQILMLRDRSFKVERLDDILMVHDSKRDVAVYFPLSKERLAGYLNSKITFQEIIIDDADTVKNRYLHNTILKAFLCDANLVMVGSPDICDMPLTKSIWKWVLNNPAFDVYVVTKPTPIEEFSEPTIALYTSPFLNVA